MSTATSTTLCTGERAVMSFTTRPARIGVTTPMTALPTTNTRKTMIWRR